MLNIYMANLIGLEDFYDEKVNMFTFDKSIISTRCIYESMQRKQLITILTPSCPPAATKGKKAYFIRRWGYGIFKVYFEMKDILFEIEISDSEKDVENVKQILMGIGE